MGCQKCKNEPAYCNNFCSKCFSGLLEKRIRKYLRETGQIQKGDALVVTDPISEYALKKIISMPVKIKPSGKGKRILRWTMDDEIDVFLQNLFDKGMIIPEKENKKAVKLFLPITDNELEHYISLKHIKNAEFNAKKRKYDFLLDQLEEKHRETRYSLIQSIETLKKILKNKKF